MSVTPADLHAHAELLQSNSEPEIRTKISRLYYALYSHSCNFYSSLPSQGNLLKNGTGSHDKLSQLLTNPTVQDKDLESKSRNLGTKQKLAHELRIKADYYWDKQVDNIDLVKCSRYVSEGMKITNC